VGVTFGGGLSEEHPGNGERGGESGGGEHGVDLLDA
jgi:hypothetical protein